MGRAPLLDEQVGEHPAGAAGPGAEGGDKLVAGDHTRLQGEQSEEEVVFRVDLVVPSMQLRWLLAIKTRGPDRCARSLVTRTPQPFPWVNDRLDPGDRALSTYFPVCLDPRTGRPGTRGPASEAEVGPRSDRVQIRIIPGPGDILPAGVHGPSQSDHCRVGFDPAIRGRQAGAWPVRDIRQQGE